MVFVLKEDELVARKCSKMNELVNLSNEKSKKVYILGCACTFSSTGFGLSFTPIRVISMRSAAFNTATTCTQTDSKALEQVHVVE